MSCRDTRSARKSKNIEKYGKRKGTNSTNKSRKEQKNKTNKLAEIYVETQEYFSEFENTEVSKLYEIQDIGIDEKLISQQSNLLVFDQLSDEKSLIEIKDEDTLDMALKYCYDGFNPLVLNMCCKFNAGGGVSRGKTAQEEVIFRRTNAFMTHPPEWYELEDNEIIYSPKVYIVRDSDYNFLEHKLQSCVGMVAVHAIKNPKLINGMYRDSDKLLMKQKIESIFKIGILRGHDSLVLGALGCGVYFNPPHEVVKIFKKMIAKYRTFYKKIGFAILTVGLSGKLNYELFNNELSSF
jgi:uncharacterized protein (TIGR02452 family)